MFGAVASLQQASTYSAWILEVHLKTTAREKCLVMGIDLTGIWESHDYECPHGTKHTELVTIRHSGERLWATKITGDDCVPAGYETFSGRLPQGATIAAIRWTTGSPRSPASSSTAGFLKIIDADTFLGGAPQMPDLTFRRQPTE